MKQKKYISVLLIIAALVLTGCSNSISAPQNNSNNKEEQVHGCTITGGININANAAPSVVQSVNSPRMATAGTEGSFFINCPDSTVLAENLTTGYTIAGRIYEVSNGGPAGYAYNITLPSSGEWLIKVNAKAGEASYYGEADVYIAYSQGSFGSSLVMQSAEPPSIVLSPLFKSGENGTIELKVINKMPNTYSTDPYTVKMIWTDGKPAAILNNVNSVSMPAAYNSESDAFNFTNVPAGAYKVEMQFCLGSKVLYSCSQWIHVFGDMKTNSWYGTGPQYAEVSGKTWLALTEEAVFAYERSQPKTYSEKSVLYSFNGIDDYYIQIISQNNYYPSFSPLTVPDDIILPGSLGIDTNCFTNNYCYGKNNTVYVAGEIMDDEYYNMYHYIYEIQQDGTTKQYYMFEDPDDQSDNRLESEIVAINFNEINGHIFIITAGKEISHTHGNYYFQKLFEVELNSSTNTAVIKKTYTIGQKNKQINTFLINDGFLYLSEYRNNCVFLDMYLIDSDNETLTQLSSKKLLDLSESKYNTNQIEKHTILINDMVNVNDSIYILMSDYYIGWDYSYCRGGVLKYDTFNKTCEDISGFATSDIYLSVGEVKYLCSSDDTYIIPTYPDQTFNDDNKYYLGVYAYNYSPANENSEFYGPKKIISYNDSYLYITDSGIKVLLDNENKTSFENINRIAKFDVKNMEIEEIVPGVDSSVKFEIEKEEIFTTGTEGYTLDNTIVYDVNGETLTGDSKVYPYILKKQN